MPGSCCKQMCKPLLPQPEEGKYKQDDILHPDVETGT